MDPVRAAQFYPKADAPVGAAVTVEDHAKCARNAETSILATVPDATDVAFLAAGRANLTWRFGSPDGQYVAKLAVRPGISDFELEGAISRLAGGLGAPTPKVIAATPRVLIAEFVAGVSLQEIDATAGDDAVSAALPGFAHALKTLHGRQLDGFGLVVAASDGHLCGAQQSWSDYLTLRLDEHLAVLTSAGITTASFAREIAASLGPLNELCDATPALLHGDCGPQNVLVAPDGGTWLVDLEDALVGDPQFELAQWATFQPERRWPTFFEAYHGAPWTPGSTFWLYFLRIVLAKAVVRVRMQIPDVSGRPTSAERLGHALAQVRGE